MTTYRTVTICEMKTDILLSNGVYHINPVNGQLEDYAAKWGFGYIVPVSGGSSIDDISEREVVRWLSDSAFKLVLLRDARFSQGLRFAHFAVHEPTIQDARNLGRSTIAYSLFEQKWVEL